MADQLITLAQLEAVVEKLVEKINARAVSSGSSDVEFRKITIGDMVISATSHTLIITDSASGKYTKIKPDTATGTESNVVIDNGAGQIIRATSVVTDSVETDKIVTGTKTYALPSSTNDAILSASAVSGGGIITSTREKNMAVNTFMGQVGDSVDPKAHTINIYDNSYNKVQYIGGSSSVILSTLNVVSSVSGIISDCWIELCFNVPKSGPEVNILFNQGVAWPNDETPVWEDFRDGSVQIHIVQNIATFTVLPGMLQEQEGDIDI